ncbi:MAG: hypothetical protein QM773_04905 [Hyphomonadaceae bacterium]
MRIERTGPVERLTPRVQRFITEALGGIALDDVQDAQARKADYACFGGLLAIELKSLEEDASERMDNLTDELRERPDWPVFLGSAPMDAFLQHLGEPEPVRRRIAERLGRAIKNHIHKANKQLAAHQQAFPRKNLVRCVVIVNEDHEIYDPQIVGYEVGHLLRRVEDGQLLYPHIDEVIYLSERHATMINGLIAFPMLAVEGQPVGDALWKRQVTTQLIERWGRWNGVPTFKATAKDQTFSTIEHVPDQMRRHEAWALHYRRDPYMQSFTDEQVRERFDEVICISSLSFLKDTPFKPPPEVTAWAMQTMTHLMQEMARRAIPATRFQHEPARLAAAAQRLGMPPAIVAWFARDLGRAA